MQQLVFGRTAAFTPCDSGCWILRPARLSGDIATLTGAWVKHYFNGVPGRGIDKLLIGPLPVAIGRLLDAAVAPAFEQRADEDDQAKGQRLPARYMNSEGDQDDTDAREDSCHRNHDSSQHGQAAGSRTTAVPYATISLIV